MARKMRDSEEIEIERMLKSTMSDNESKSPTRKRRRVSMSNGRSRGGKMKNYTIRSRVRK